MLAFLVVFVFAVNAQCTTAIFSLPFIVFCAIVHIVSCWSVTYSSSVCCCSCENPKNCSQFHCITLLPQSISRSYYFPRKLLNLFTAHHLLCYDQVTVNSCMEGCSSFLTASNLVPFFSLLFFLESHQSGLFQLRSSLPFFPLCLKFSKDFPLY